MAAWNMSEVILAEGLAEVGAEDPPASDLRFVNTCFEDEYVTGKCTNLAAAGPSPVTPWNPWKPCGAPRPEPPAAALSALEAKLQAGHWGFIKYRPPQKTPNIDHTAFYRPNIDRKSSLKSAYLHISRQKCKCLLGQDYILLPRRCM